MMHRILIIPSWYPTPELPYAGGFILAQARALAENQLAQLGILNWGQLEYQLALRTPIKSLKKFKSFIHSRSNEIIWENGITEFRIPHLSWTHHILDGNIDHLIPKLNRLPRFDLIHAHVGYPAGYIAMKLSEMTGTPFIITEHSGPFPLKGLSKGDSILPIVSEPIKAAKVVVAVSSALARDIEAKTGVQCRIIPNLVDHNFFTPALCPIPNKAFSLFALSSLTKQKGIWDLLEAMRIVKSRGGNVDLRIGGTGPLMQPLKRKIQKLGLEPEIKLLGKLSPVQALTYYQSCDCFIMPSHHESFSMVLLEAMACGKPIIATACGGPQDIINDHIGYLVPSQNPMALAEAVLSMRENFRHFDPESIRRHCINAYSPSTVAKQISDVYHDVIRPAHP